MQTAEQGGADGAEDAYAELAAFVGGDGEMETALINGRTYTIYAVPYCG
jgi:hypothetical protein